MRGYTVRWHRRRGQPDEPLAVFTFDADECDSVAAMLGSDGWADELRQAAIELRQVADERGL